MDQTRLDYIKTQLDRTRAAADVTHSPWSRQWLAHIEARLVREVEMAKIDARVSGTGR